MSNIFYKFTTYETNRRVVVLENGEREDYSMKFSQQNDEDLGLYNNCERIRQIFN